MPLIISATDAKNQFSELVNRVIYNNDEFIVQKQGKPVVLISRIVDTQKNITQKFTTNDFLAKLTGIKATNLPSDVGKNHDTYAWDR